MTFVGFHKEVKLGGAGGGGGAHVFARGKPLSVAMFPLRLYRNKLEPCKSGE